MATLVQTREEYNAKSKRLDDIFAEAGEDMDLSKVTLVDGDAAAKGAAINSLITEVANLGVDLGRLQEFDKEAKANRERLSLLNKPATPMVHPAAQKGDGNGFVGGQIVPIRKSISEQVFADPQLKEWFDRTAPNGRFSDGLQFTSPAVQVKDLITGGSSTSAGAVIYPDRMGLVDLPFRPLTLRDIVTVMRTNSDSIEYARVTGYTNAAAIVAEATATAGSSGVKPESAMALEVVTATVRTIAHWIATTRQALSDAPQLQGLIDTFLIEGLRQALEDQMATGSGTGQNFEGIASISGSQTQAWDTNFLTTTRKARTKVATVGRDIPNAFLMHPNDRQTYDLLQDNEARYYNGGPRVLMQPVLWGLPIVESEAITQGTAYVGNFKQCVLWEREDASIQISNSHSDFFVRNLVALLAEMRAAFGCRRPASIVEIDITA